MRAQQQVENLAFNILAQRGMTKSLLLKNRYEKVHGGSNFLMTSRNRVGCTILIIFLWTESQFNVMTFFI